MFHTSDSDVDAYSILCALMTMTPEKKKWIKHGEELSGNAGIDNLERVRLTRLNGR